MLGTALLAGAYTFAILGYAWSGLRYMAGTLALGVAGTLLLFYGLRVIIDRLARRGDRAGNLRVFNFRQVEETVIHDKESRLLICIMRDVTQEEREREKKESISHQTIEVADKVVDKQMRIVQEIASLRGETAAETKIALTKLKESITNE